VAVLVLGWSSGNLSNYWLTLAVFWGKLFNILLSDPVKTSALGIAEWVCSGAAALYLG